MNKDYLIQLTQKLYRLTFLFPKKEPLRYKMREIGNEILADLVPKHISRDNLEKVVGDLEVLDSFFEITKTQNWVAFDEILKLQNKYSKLREDLSKFSKEESQIKIEPLDHLSNTSVALNNNSINERQKKILEILKEKEKAQVWEIKKIFPEVSKRTLRRDFEKLLKQGLIDRIGERNDTFYILKGRTN